MQAEKLPLHLQLLSNQQLCSPFPRVVVVWRRRMQRHLPAAALHLLWALQPSSQRPSQATEAAAAARRWAHPRDPCTASHHRGRPAPRCCCHRLTLLEWRLLAGSSSPCPRVRRPLYPPRRLHCRCLWLLQQRVVTCSGSSSSDSSQPAAPPPPLPSSPGTSTTSPRQLQPSQQQQGRRGRRRSPAFPPSRPALPLQGL